MKIQIDTNAKTIKIEGNVKLSDLFDQLQKFFPDGEWEDYNLETNTVIYNWGNPIVINKPYPYPWIGTPFYVGGSNTITNCAGTDINHHNNENFTLTTTSAGGTMYIDMSNEPLPEVCASGYAQFESGIYNIELN